MVGQVRAMSDEIKHGLCCFCIQASNCEKAGEGIYSCPEFEESPSPQEKPKALQDGEGLKIIVECVSCLSDFDILEAKWCKHDGATKVCPNCGECACDTERVLKAGFTLSIIDPSIKGICGIWAREGAGDRE